ncbi:MAG: hypothetical protein WC282_01945, partial [Bacilli bacterium]
MKKQREIKPIPKESIMGVIGLMIALLAVVAILSPLPKETSFIAKFFVMVFGFVGFWAFFSALFILGIYMMFNRRLMKIRFDITMIGIFVVVIAVLTIASNLAILPEQDMRLDNFIAIFEPIASAIDSTGIIYDWQTGGGYVGFFFAALFNTLITRNGSLSVFFILAFIGLCLIFNRQIKKWYLQFKAYMKRRKEQNQYFGSVKTEKPVEHDEIAFAENAPLEKVATSPIKPVASPVNKPTPTPERRYQPQPSFQTVPLPTPAVATNNNQSYDNFRFQVKSFSGTKGLRKAIFVMDGDQPPREEQTSYEDTYQRPISQVPVSSKAEEKKDPVFEEVKEETRQEAPAAKSAAIEVQANPAPLIEAKPQVFKPRPYRFPSLDLPDNHES